MISIDDFQKIELRVGKILTVEKVPETDKLLRLTVDFGLKPSLLKEGSSELEIKEEVREVRQIVSGIAGYFPIIELLKKIKTKHYDFNISGVFYINNGKVIGGGRANGILNLDELPFAAWDLLPMAKYRSHHRQAWDYGLDQSNFALIYTCLGCPFQCDYCSVNTVYGSGRPRYRSVSNVVDEIKYLVDTYNIRHLEIIDDLFTMNVQRVHEFCDKIIQEKLHHKLNMWCFARTNTVSVTLMKKMKQAGINWVFMGFEAGNDDILKGINKHQTINQIKQAVQIALDSGMYIGGNYVFGLPNDTYKTMNETLSLALELNTPYANFFMFMPYPGTKLYDIAIQKKIRITK
ncbi:MAG: Radical SAM domain protein [Candidatus Nomurabacteria bacterium GW2011_GWB1_37_5]|uniref:Radical SAM domain protein n=1 Tax=Candidatus Nomurabacteria bacterium GW2011_GWB1_37_5 TaxID=1618742 RepID=A0A0G0H7Q0_9BACT|nr:MAG: Radical SAM domain protein [Candidatus Nomurabacteria bacterium GW2011_GWB1_37_5]